MTSALAQPQHMTAHCSRFNRTQRLHVHSQHWDVYRSRSRKRDVLIQWAHRPLKDEKRRTTGTSNNPGTYGPPGTPIRETQCNVCQVCGSPWNAAHSGSQTSQCTDVQNPMERCASASALSSSFWKVQPIDPNGTLCTQLPQVRQVYSREDANPHGTPYVNPELFNNINPQHGIEHASYFIYLFCESEH